jgi:DNA repair protein SbcC/Rad50
VSGVRISRLHIDAFRGISAPITFDFSAPITVVFAPNGTGKTTLCEAAEWLLTGQIDRLLEGQHFDASVLRSKFLHEEEREPTVSAQISLGSSSSFLRRTLDGAFIGIDSENVEKIGLGDLLGLLAPAAAAEDAHHITAISLRRHWLRGTRFLSAEALAALVDTDEATIDRRTQVFADLLGIRHLLDGERACTRYADDLSQRERSLAASVSGQDREARQLQDALRAVQQAGTPTTSAVMELQTAEHLLEIDSSVVALDPVNLDARLDAAAAEQGRRDYALNVKRVALSAVETGWNRRIELEAESKRLSREERAFSEELSAVDASGRQASSDVEQLTVTRNAETERHRSLMVSRDALLSAIHRLQQAFGQLQEPDDEDRFETLGHLRAALPESAWTAAARSARLQQVRDLIAEVPNIAADASERRQLEQACAALRERTFSDQAMGALRTQEAAAKQAAELARRRLEATSNPLQRLQAAGRDFLEHLHDDSGHSACPLCTANWRSVRDLRDAIATALESVPVLTAEAQTAVAAAEQAAFQATARLQDAQRQRSQLAELSQSLRSVVGRVEERRKRQLQEGIADDVVDLRTHLERRERHLLAAEALADLLYEQDQRAVLAFSGLVLTDSVPLANASLVLSSATAASEQALQLRLADITKQLDARNSERETLRRRYVVIQAALRERRSGLATITPELKALRDQWALATGTGPSTLDGLKLAQANIAIQRQALAAAASHLAAARSAWNVEVRRGRLAELEKSIEPLEARRRRMQDRIDGAHRARAEFRATYTDISRKQVDDLSRVVNPLFARMHANRVFDQINLGEADDFLHWLADAGTAQLDPGKDFSQGQRQDLALALFLARARGLEGTFFLDEPVTHLDDLNRVGLLDVFRATVMESGERLNLVVTTASKALARHLVEKFVNVRPFGLDASVKPLRVIELDGNGRTGITMTHVYPTAS